MMRALHGVIASSFRNASGIPTTNLVAAYDLDSDLTDNVASNDGTAVSSAAYTAGYIGQAIDGDGTNYVTLPDLGISGSTPRTISFWYKRGTTTTIKSALGWGAVATRQSCIAHIGAVSTGDIYWAFNNRDYYTSGSQVNTSTFTHICMVYDGGILSTSTVKIYVGNVSQSLTQAGTLGGAAATADSNYTLMTDIGDLSGRVSDGQLDLVRIYDRALTASEITSLYNEV